MDSAFGRRVVHFVTNSRPPVVHMGATEVRGKLSVSEYLLLLVTPRVWKYLLLHLLDVDFPGMMLVVAEFSKTKHAELGVFTLKKDTSYCTGSIITQCMTI